METNCRGITRSYTGDYNKLFTAGRRLAKKGTLVLVRGLPGSGKSHLAEELRSLTSAEMGVCSADDFSTRTGSTTSTLRSSRGTLAVPKQYVCSLLD